MEKTFFTLVKRLSICIREKMLLYDRLSRRTLILIHYECSLFYEFLFVGILIENSIFDTVNIQLNEKIWRISSFDLLIYLTFMGCLFFLYIVFETLCTFTFAFKFYFILNSFNINISKCIFTFLLNLLIIINTLTFLLQSFIIGIIFTFKFI